ncbi:Cat eye syndrome critical region 1-like protein [Cladobotryum mycophilum]|uniref:Cat eye syndrome critical region 1-like protein n=1 Tax=Cladobotryum mycophilum TaxID=491253 RepID=A0ABR0SWU8_9HYPO
MVSFTLTRNFEQRSSSRGFSLSHGATSAHLIISSSPPMGAILSVYRKHKHKAASKMPKHNQDHDLRPPKRSRTGDRPLTDQEAASKLIQAHDDDIESRRTEYPNMDLPERGTPTADLSGQLLNADPLKTVEEKYWKARQQIVQREDAVAFDFRCKAGASGLEERVDKIIRKLRDDDVDEVYNEARPRRGHGGQLHPRFEGDHFLSNLDLIKKTKIFDVVSMMPKGAHLHIHFNACLEPHVLLDIAKKMDRMFITSNFPLIPDGDYENYDRCEIQFSIMSSEKENPGNLFSPSYRSRQTMKFNEFLQQFPKHYSQETAENWLLRKLVFEEQETYGVLQTAAGAWEKFNGRTRMMKGLFNYERAYREYTRKCLEDFVRDGIQYAEIRPNFMMSNQLYTDDGKKTIDNRGIMKLIINEVKRFQKDMADKNQYFGGLKVIYCTPRAFKPEDVEAALEECLQFKIDWPEWIAGFDLVGEESKGNPIKKFVPQLLEFKRKCNKVGVDIPFLFHCGETLDVGADTDGNLVDALLLGSKRIGHGFALAKHPYIMQQMKAQNICLELCPISNEILGLTPRVGGHAMYPLLANNVHCTVSSDNGTLFRSSLSHDFYQVLVGKADMGLFGWKQLILWSLEHSCLGDEERTKMMHKWERLWDEFLRAVVHKYGEEPARGKL